MSAQREQAKYTQSLKYSLDQLTAHGEKFWSTFINKDDVKFFIDSINILITGATKLVDVLGALPTTAGTLGLFSSLKGGGLVRTVTNELGQTSLTGNGFLKDLKGMATGDFFKKESIISKADEEALKAYNAEIERGIRPSIAFHKTMKQSSEAAQHLAKSANGATVNIGAIPKVSRAATVGLKALSVAMNIGLTLIISELISGIFKMAGAYEEMSQQAADATTKFKEQSSSLEEYKGKITELKTALSSENLTYTDARDKRTQLLDIQKQLIDAYGAEAKGIDLVNGSLDNQIGKLDKLSKQKRQEWENEVNKLSTGQWWQKWVGIPAVESLFNGANIATFGFAGGLRSLITGKTPISWIDSLSNKSALDSFNNFDNTTNIERITKKVENFSKSINFKGLNDDLKSQLESYKGVSFDGNKMTIAGDAKTVADTVSQIQTQVVGSREDLKWLNQDLKDIYNSASKIVGENWDTYNQAIENKILNDDTGLKYYEQLTKAYETYQDAVESGNEVDINKAKENYSKILSDIAGSNMPDTFKHFFEDMYPDVADIINDWKFEVNITPKINNNTDGLKDDIESVKGLTTDDIVAAFENNGTDGSVTPEQWKAITNLNKEAQSQGLDLSTFLEQLREAGYLVSQLDKNVEKTVNDAKNKYGNDTDWDKYFKDNSIDTEEELDRWNKVTSGINDAEEAKRAYAIATEELNEGSNTLEGISKVLDNIQSAYNTVSSAVKEYAKNGALSVDTFQSLLNLEPQYLNMLLDENGNLNLNTDSVNKNTAAYIENMGIKAAYKMLDTLGTYKTEAEQLDYLSGTLKDNTISTWANVYAKLEQMKLEKQITDEVYNATFTRIRAYEQMTEAAKAGIGKGGIEGFDKAISNADRLKNRFELVNHELEKLATNLDLLSTKLDMTFDKDFSSKIEILGQEFLEAGRYSNSLRAELDKLLQTTPANAEEAEALADQLESLGDKFYDNQRKIIEYRKEAHQARAEMIAEMAEMTADANEQLSDIVSETFDIMENGSVTGGIFSSRVIQPFTEDAVKRQRQENDELIEEEKRYREAIAEIREKAIKKAQAEAEAASAKLVAETKSAGDKIEKDVKDTSQNVIDTITDTVDQISKIQINPPSLNTTAWNTFEESFKKKFGSLGVLGWKSGDNQGAADAALKQLGVTYGTGKGQLDCSALVQYAYAQIGKTIGRTTFEQIKQTTLFDNISDLQPGDLIFTDFSERGPEHVGMYLGKGEVIASSSSRGQVIKQKLNNGYWNKGTFGRVFATGTKDYGIAGENYKKEFAVNKKTGEWHEINSPTLFDQKEYDIVGEKVSEKIDKPIPMFATGTPTGNANYQKWIKEACDALGIPYNIAFSLIDQESGGGAESGTWKFNSVGAYGLTQITQDAIADLTDGTATANKYKKLLESNGINLDKARGGGEAYARDNIWTGLATLAAIKDRYFNGDDSDFSKSLGWYYAGGDWNGKNGKWYANQVINRANTDAFLNLGNKANLLYKK